MMETTDKGMKIVVSRAPRVKTTRDIPNGSDYMNSMGSIFRKMASGGDVVIDLAKGRCPQLWDGAGFYVFEDFDDVAKWVVAGRKLEDLGGNGKDEWVGSGRLERGKYYTLMGGDPSLRDKIVGHAFFFQVGLVNDFPVLDLSSGIGYRQDALTDCMFWPIDLERGDTITITCK